MIIGKNIDYTPDFTSDAYWDTHHIGLATVIAAEDKAGRRHITHRLDEQFSEGAAQSTRTEPLHRYWFGMDVVEAPTLNRRDRLVVSYPKTTPGQIVTYKVTPQAPLVRALRQIKGLRRGQGGADALANAALSQNWIVSVYALRKMLAQPQLPRRPSLVSQLQTARDDVRRSPRVRVLANQLANKLAGQPPKSDAEYAWLSTNVAKLRVQDWSRVRPFTDRLLEFRRLRAQTAKLLTRIATDSAGPLPLRIGAYAAFDDARLFDFAKPDATSETILAASETMLRDRNELIRRAGIALLHNLSVGIAAPWRQAYIGRARRAIGSLAQREPNPAVRFHCETYLEQLEHATPKV